MVYYITSANSSPSLPVRAGLSESMCVRVRTCFTYQQINARKRVKLRVLFVAEVDKAKSTSVQMGSKTHLDVSLSH